MHLSEFQAWFKGFTEDMKVPPNWDQWAKIKKCVKEITPAPPCPIPLWWDLKIGDPQVTLSL